MQRYTNQLSLHPGLSGGPKRPIEYIVYFYNFNRLQKISKTYKNISRRFFLQKLFERLTYGANTNRDKWLKIESSLSEIIYHNPLNQPTYKNKTIPSVYELSKSPETLNQLPFRNWTEEQNYRRTVDGRAFPNSLYYPGELSPSATYFGKQIFMNRFTGNKKLPRTIAIYYYYKLGSAKKWRSRAR